MSMKNFLLDVKKSAMRSRGEVEDAIDARRGECASTAVLELEAKAYDAVIHDLNVDIRKCDNA